jgi:hypothetical protein
MSIKQTVNFSQFCDSFSDTYKDNFTHDGKKVLFDYLENLSDDIGEDIELDIIALCCEYTQYDDVEDFIAQYGYTDIKKEDFNTYDTPKDNLEDFNKAVMDDLYNKTQVITIDGSDGFIIANY